MPVTICPDAVYRSVIETTNAEKHPLGTIPESIYRQLEAIVVEVGAEGRDRRAPERRSDRQA